MFVITLIHYNPETYPYIPLFGPKMGHYFVHYNCEFVITLIAITEFDCTYRGQFDQHFTRGFFVQKCLSQLFSTHM